MESTIYGKIQCNKISDSRALRRFTERQIQNWIRKKFTEASRNPVTYWVELRREGSGHTFDCHIRVSSGNQTWVGFNYRKEIHQALIHCLQQMSPIPATS